MCAAYTGRHTGTQTGEQVSKNNKRNVQTKNLVKHKHRIRFISIKMVIREIMYIRVKPINFNKKWNAFEKNDIRKISHFK
jgi:hypothetical protein